MNARTNLAVRRARHGVAAIATAAMLALTACGDDKEGPAEDVGKAIDKGGEKLGKEAKEAERDLDDGKKD